MKYSEVLCPENLQRISGLTDPGRLIRSAREVQDLDLPAFYLALDLWPLLVYTVPATTVKAMERNISSSALYGTSNIMQLPFSDLPEEFMVSTCCNMASLAVR